MSESLSEEQLAELVRSGRVNTSRSSAKRRQTKTSGSRSTKAQTSAQRAIDSPREVELTTSKELDAEWLRVEKEKAERNMAAERQDKRRREEMREASRF